MDAFPALLTSRVVPILRDDIDTDQIIPARYLKVTDKSGLAEGLFSSWRYFPDGSPDPTFPLNSSEYQGSRVLLAGDNFGCGSSREHAPWALTGWGFQAVISTSFADIFRSNSLKNGLLPVIVDSQVHQQLRSLLQANPKTTVTIDLARQTLQMPDVLLAFFPIDPFSKLCLLEGIDQLGYLLKHEEQIANFENQLA